MAEQSPQMQLLGPMLEAIKKVFQIQLSTPVDFKDIGPKAGQSTLKFDLAAVLGMTSSKMTGSLIILFPETTFLPIVNRMLGESYSKINSENRDAAAEILNIIYGSARPIINRLGHDFAPAIPSVATGGDLTFSHTPGATVLVVPCKADVGEFELELGVKLL